MAKIEITTPEKQTLADLVRQAMAIPHLKEASTSVGMSYRMFVLIRKLLILKDRNVMKESEIGFVDNVLQLLETHRYKKPMHNKFQQALDLSQPILERYWRAGTADGTYKGRRQSRPMNKTRMRFERTLFAIQEACSNNDELEIPILTAEERIHFRDLLIRSASALWYIERKITKGEDHD